MELIKETRHKEITNEINIYRKKEGRTVRTNEITKYINKER